MNWEDDDQEWLIPGNQINESIVDDNSTDRKKSFWSESESN